MKQTVISLDPIDRKKDAGLFSRLLMTRWSGGKIPAKTDKYGHYMFCGRQRSGKSVSVLWYAEKLMKQYAKRKYAIAIYSNIGIGTQIKKNTTAFSDVIEPLLPVVGVAVLVGFMFYVIRWAIGLFRGI